MRTRTLAQPLPMLGMQTLQIKIPTHPNECTHGYKARGYSLICPKQGYAAGQGRVYSFARVCPKQPVLIINRVLPVHCLHDRFDTRQRSFTPCPKQGDKVDGVVLNRVCISGSSCPKRKLLGLKSCSQGMRRQLIHDL